MDFYSALLTRQLIPVGPKGDTGETGNGILKIEKIATSDNVDIYTITYTNGQTTTFTVTNGVNGIAENLGLVVSNGKLCVVLD